MLATVTWQHVSAAGFEDLALEHVRDLYPEFTWRSTSLSADGGKDAIGELRDLGEGLSEIYWMEAKHHPARRSIGKYTLDTHLVSTFFSRGVRRLHVVTSGTLSPNFIIRADAFSREHGFAFAYTDRESLEAWLSSRIDLIQRYFGDEAEQTIAALASLPPTRAVFARALLLPESDALAVTSVAATCLLPGKKFRLVVMLSLAGRITRPGTRLRLSWAPPADRVSLLAPVGRGGHELELDPLHDIVASVPFRLLRYGRDPLPDPTLSFADGTAPVAVELRVSTDLPRLASPFVGKEARTSLLALRRMLREEVANGRPRLVVCRGRAGRREDAALRGAAGRRAAARLHRPADRDDLDLGDAGGAMEAPAPLAPRPGPESFPALRGAAA